MRVSTTGTATTRAAGGTVRDDICGLFSDDAHIQNECSFFIMPLTPPGVKGPVVEPVETA
jgi:hypothetical protein